MVLAADHPITPLRFALDGNDFLPSTVARLADVIAALAASRRWTIEPPRFIDTRTDAKFRDDSTRTVGGELDLYSALPPWGSQLPLEVDRANLEDAEQVVAAMAEFSRGTGTRIVFSLNDEDIGSIDKGAGDRGITVGLLGEWRRILGAKS